MTSQDVKKRSWKSSIRKQEQIVRLFVLLEFVSSGRPSRSVKEIYDYMASRFGICERTAKRDLGTMRRIGVVAATSDRNGTLGMAAKAQSHDRTLCRQIENLFSMRILATESTSYQTETNRAKNSERFMVELI